MGKRKEFPHELAATRPSRQRTENRLVQCLASRGRAKPLSVAPERSSGCGSAAHGLPLGNILPTETGEFTFVPAMEGCSRFRGHSRVRLAGGDGHAPQLTRDIRSLVEELLGQCHACSWGNGPISPGKAGK